MWPFSLKVFQEALPVVEKLTIGSVVTRFFIRARCNGLPIEAEYGCTGECEEQWRMSCNDELRIARLSSFPDHCKKFELCPGRRSF